MAYKDRLLFQAGSKGFLDADICVMDEHGIKVVYEETLNDMVALEEEMLKIGSFYLNKAELLQHSTANDSQQSTMMDRGEVCANLLEGELELQVVKIELTEILLQVYEHCCDPLESVRVLQMIADTMAIRPRVNLDATYLKDSYTAEIECLRQKVALYTSILQLQVDTEKA